MTKTAAPLLEDDSSIAIAGTIHFLAAEFGNQLGDQVNAKLSPMLPNWFTLLKAERLRQGQPAYDSFRDTRFLLKEALAEAGVVDKAIVAFGTEWRDTAIYLRNRLNLWFHNSLAPNLVSFEQIVGSLAKLAALSQLDLAQNLADSLERAKAIASGEYVQAKPSATLVTTAADKMFFDELAKKQAEIVKRPPVGSPWLGAKATRNIKISKSLKDVTENGVSIKSLLGTNAEDVVTEWLRYYPRGGDARIAEDGAVMGHNKGQWYLIGYISNTPTKPKQQLQGFALPYEYIFTGNDVRDLMSNKLLSNDAKDDVRSLLASLKTSLSEGDLFNATAYGEIFVQGEDGETQVIGHVNKDTWFKGHLPDAQA